MSVLANAKLEGAASEPATTGGHGPPIPSVLQPDNDDDGPLYAPRRKIYPQSVTGFYRRLKWSLLLVTLGIYYGLPFVRWERGPNAPNQAVLVDFPGRRFYFFFVELWPQEIYHFTGLLIIAAITLFLMNAVAGRISLPANRLDRSVPGGRAPRRRRPSRAHTARERALDSGAAWPRRAKALPLADDCLVDRRCLGPLLRGRSDPR